MSTEEMWDALRGRPDWPTVARRYVEAIPEADIRQAATALTESMLAGWRAAGLLDAPRWPELVAVLVRAGFWDPVACRCSSAWYREQIYRMTVDGMDVTAASRRAGEELARLIDFHGGRSRPSTGA
jgi:hypothetical protein